MSVVIRVENLTKKYILRHEAGHSYVALRDVISGSVKRAIKKEKTRVTKEDFVEST